MSNNNSVLVLGLAAILLIAGLGGAAAFAIGNSNNSVVDYAPENSYELREYASEISSINSTDVDEITLYSSLMNKAFVSDSNRIRTITSVESFSDYLSSIGYYVNTDDSTYSLRSYTMQYDNVLAYAKAEAPKAAVQLYGENVDVAPNKVLVTSTQYGVFTNICKNNTNFHNIETMTASTFANLSFAMTMPFEANSISDLIAILSDVDSDTQLSDFFGGYLYYEVSSMSENSKDADVNLDAVATVTMRPYVINCASELQYYLRTVDSTVNWFDLNIRFNAPLTTLVADASAEKAPAAAALAEGASSSEISTVGDLVDYLNEYNSAKTTVAVTCAS